MKGEKSMFSLLKQLFWIFALLVFMSCEQDPLKNFPEKLKESVYTTGPDNQSILDSHFLSSESIRVTLNGKSELILSFKEEKESGYILKVQPLYSEFPFKIDVKLPEEILLLFPGLEWKYYQDKKEIIITWQPARKFAGYQRLRQITVPFNIELKDLKNLKAPPLIVNRDLVFKVTRDQKTPKIIKYSYDSINYELLEDGRFYEIPTNEKINLRLSRMLYKRSDNYRKPGAAPLSSRNYRQHPYDYYEEEEAVDEKGVIFDIPIVSIIKHPFYKEKVYDTRLVHSSIHPIDKEVYLRLKRPIYEKKDCASSDDVQKENGKSICYMELEGAGDVEIDLNLEIYEAYYVLPEKLIYEDNNKIKKEIIFNATVFNVYKKNKGGDNDCFDASNKKESFVLKEKDKSYSCYVQSLYLDIFLNQEKNDLYYFPDYISTDETGSSYPLLDVQLEKKFRLMPKSLKLLIAGYNSTSQAHDLIFNSEDSKLLEIYVEDLNYIPQGPTLSPLALGDIFSSLKATFFTRTEDPDNETTWIFKYNIKDKKLEDIDYQAKYSKAEVARDTLNAFNLTPISFTPLSTEGSVKSGLEALFNINSFPRVQAFHEERIEDSLNNTKITQDIRAEDKEGVLVNRVYRTSLNLFHHVKINYIFPKRSFETLIELVPKNRDLSKFDKTFYLEDLNEILDIQLKPYEVSLPSNPLDCIRIERSDDEKYKNLFQPISCSCELDGQEKEDYEGKRIVSRQCVFKIKLNVDSGVKTEAFYANYRYGFQKNKIHLNQDIFNQEEELQVMNYSVDSLSESSRKANLLYVYPEGSLDLEGISYRHFFFNLNPSLNCLNDSVSKVNECEISYKYNNRMNENLTNKTFFVDLTCQDSNGIKYPCPCEKDIQIYLAGDQEVISRKCSFKKGKHGLVSTSLGTKMHNVFFMSNDGEEINTENLDAVRTTGTNTFAY